MRYIRYFSIFFILSVFWSCGAGLSNAKHSLNRLKLNMSKEEVKMTMGIEGQARALETTSEGKTKEVWEYSFADLLDERADIYRMIFIDDRLVKWEKI